MEAVDQLASAGTFRVVKEPLAFLRVLEWVVACIKVAQLVLQNQSLLRYHLWKSLGTIGGVYRAVTELAQPEELP